MNIFFVKNASTELHRYWRNQVRRVRDNKFTQNKSPRTRELRLYLIALFRWQCWIPTGEDDKSYRNNLLAGALQSLDNLRRLKKKQTRRIYILRLEKKRKNSDWRQKIQMRECGRENTDAAHWSKKHAWNAKRWWWYPVDDLVEREHRQPHQRNAQTPVARQTTQFSSAGAQSAGHSFRRRSAFSSTVQRLDTSFLVDHWFLVNFPATGYLVSRRWLSFSSTFQRLVISFLVDDDSSLTFQRPGISFLVHFPAIMYLVSRRWLNFSSTFQRLSTSFLVDDWFLVNFPATRSVVSRR